MLERVSVVTARNNLSDLLNRVAYGGETVIIESRGKPKAALVSTEALITLGGRESLIVSTPGVRSGKPRIAGRRITVSDIVIWHQRLGMAPQQIAADYDLSLAQVYAALSYYYAHQDEIDAEIAESVRFAEALKEADRVHAELPIKQDARSAVEAVRRLTTLFADASIAHLDQVLDDPMMERINIDLALEQT